MCYLLVLDQEVLAVVTYPANCPGRWFVFWKTCNCGVSCWLKKSKGIAVMVDWVLKNNNSYLSSCLFRCRKTTRFMPAVVVKAAFIFSHYVTWRCGLLCFPHRPWPCDNSWSGGEDCFVFLTDRDLLVLRDLAVKTALFSSPSVTFSVMLEHLGDLAVRTALFCSPSVTFWCWST